MPEVAVDDGRVYVSWNGATEVSMWSLNGTDEGVEGESVFLGRFPKGGFETEIPVPTNLTGRYFFVSALDSAGQVLGSTSATQWPSKPRQGLIHQGL